jgi:hypothetical protein
MIPAGRPEACAGEQEAVASAALVVLDPDATPGASEHGYGEGDAATMAAMARTIPT